MMFVEYAGLASDSIRMWDSVKAQVIVTRDVIWLKTMFFKVPHLMSSSLTHLQTWKVMSRRLLLKPTICLKSWEAE